MEQECGEKTKNIMNRKTIYDDDAHYTDAPPDVEAAFARSVRIKDFLPPPEKLVLRTNVASIQPQPSRSTFRKVAAIL